MEAQTMTAGKPRSKARPDFGTYQRLDDETLPKKIAHFLNWCAENRPKEWISYNQIAFSILGLKHMPRLINREVVMVRKVMSRVRPVLIEKYKRTMIAAPGLGVRGTTDSADIVTTELAKSVHKLERDSTRTAQLYNLVDPDQLPKTEEFKPWLEWFNRQTAGGGLFKMITSNDWAKRVALPPRPESEKKA